MIIINTHQAKSYFEKIAGLIGQTSKKSIFLKTRFGIHTLGMRIPIDILVLNSKYQVVRIKENLTPYNFFFWNPKYNLVVELPCGTVQLEKIKEGSRIKINFIP